MTIKHRVPAIVAIMTAALMAAACGDSPPDTSSSPRQGSLHQARVSSPDMPQGPGETSDSQGGSPESTAATVGVNDFAANPAARQGPVAIEGIVSQVFAERGAFVLIDLTEFESCGLT